MRRTALLAALALGAGCAAGPAVAPGAPRVDPSVLAEKARRAEAAIRERFLTPEGLLVYRRPLDRPPDLVRGPYGDLADAACWGGYLLGAEALRLAATGDDGARAAVGRVLAGIEALEAVTGTPGLLARTLDRNLSPAELARRGGEWRKGAIPGTFYRGDVSKDQYAGVLFGLGSVVRYAGPGELRDRAGALLVRIADRMARHGDSIADRDGRVTTHGDLSPFFLGAPLAVNAAIALVTYRLSDTAGGPPSHRRRYEALVARGWARSASHAKVSILGKTNRNNDHMATACLIHLFALARDPGERELYRRGLARVAAGVRGEGNALFLGYHLVASGKNDALLAEALAALALLPVERRSRPVDLRGQIDGVVPMDLRVPSSFVWRSDPTELEWGVEKRRAPREYAPVDYLVAYWLLRAHGLIE